MKKTIVMIFIAVSMLLPFTLTVCAEENISSKANSEKIEFTQYSAFDIDDSIQSALKVKRGDTVIRVYNVPVVFAFKDYNNIEEILKSNHIRIPVYVVMRDDELISAYTVDENMKVTDQELENSLFTAERATVWNLINHVVEKKLSKGTNILDVYYLWGGTNHQGSALYYKTDKGDFVYYTFGGQYLFPASDFFAFMKAVYETMGPDTPPGEPDIESVWDLSKYEVNFTEADMRTDVAWWHILLWVSGGAVLVLGGVACGISLHKKYRRVKNGEVNK